MTTPNSTLAGRPTVAWENEGGALAPVPGRDATADRAGPWRRLMTLAAMMSVWRDLSVGVRRSIARDATAAMPRAESCADPRPRRAQPPMRTTRRPPV